LHSADNKNLPADGPPGAVYCRDKKNPKKLYDHAICVRQTRKMPARA